MALRYLDIPSYILPAPTAVWNALRSGIAVSSASPLGYYLPLWGTLKNAALGLAIGSGLGLVLGSLMCQIALKRRPLIALKAGSGSFSLQVRAVLTLVSRRNQHEEAAISASQPGSLRIGRRRDHDRRRSCCRPSSGDRQRLSMS